MQPLYTTGPELRAYHETLAGLHGRRRERRSLTLLNLNDQPLGPLAGYGLDGQIDIDATGTPTRTMRLTLGDPFNTAIGDPDSPAAGVIAADRQLRATHSLYVPPLARWIDCIPFTGPIRKADRTGSEVNIEAAGREVLFNRGCRGYTIPKGELVVDAIRTILRRGGQRRFRFPAWIKERLTEPVKLGWAQETWPWVVATRLAADVSCRLYFDGPGFAVLEPRKIGAAVFTFGPRMINGELQITRDWAALENYVIVTSPKVPPKGDQPGRPAISRDAVAPASHSYSPQKLAVNGEPQYLGSGPIEDTRATTGKDLQRRADAELADRLNIAVEVAVDLAPVWHLDILDGVRIDEESSVLTKASIPWGPAPSMSWGYHKRVSKPRRRIRA